MHTKISVSWISKEHINGNTGHILLILYYYFLKIKHALCVFSMMVFYLSTSWFFISTTLWIDKPVKRPKRQIYREREHRSSCLGQGAIMCIRMLLKAYKCFKTGLLWWLYNLVNLLKRTELHTWSLWIIYYVKYASIK